MRSEKTKKLVTLSILVAIIVVLQLLSNALLTWSGLSLSLCLIPIVLGAAFYGPSAGAILGAAFGVVTYINCVTGGDPSGNQVFIANPILCFVVVMVKSVAAGLSAGFVYKWLKNKNGYVAMLLASIVCPVVNTGIFLTCLVTMFGGVLDGWHTNWLGNGNAGSVATFILSVIVLVNFVPELLMNVAFSPAGQRILKAVKK